MKERDQLIQLGAKVWEYRKEFGFSKKLSEDIQREAAKLCKSGLTAYSIGKALGVPRNTISDWTNRFAAEEPIFSEVAVVDSNKTNFEVRLSSIVEGCRVEITGTDYSVLQRLLRRMVR